jgi:hypothetical protein
MPVSRSEQSIPRKRAKGLPVSAAEETEDIWEQDVYEIATQL